MDQAQYDGLLSNLRNGKSGLSGSESKNYVVEGEKLYYRDSDKNGKNDLLVLSYSRYFCSRYTPTIVVAAHVQF